MRLTFVPQNICVNMPLDPYVTMMVKSHALCILFREEINIYLKKHCTNILVPGIFIFI